MSKNLSRGVDRGNLPAYPQRDKEVNDIFEDVDQQIDQEVSNVMKMAKIDPNELITADFLNVATNKDRLQYSVFSQLKNRVYSNEMLDKMKEKYKTFQIDKSDKNLAGVYKSFFGRVVKPVVLTYNLKLKVTEFLADKIDVEKNAEVVGKVIMGEVEKDLNNKTRIKNIRSLANKVLISADLGEMPKSKGIVTRSIEGLGRTPQMKVVVDKFRKGEITPAEFSKYVQLEEAIKIVKRGGEVENYSEIKKAGEKIMEKIAGKKMKGVDESINNEVDYAEKYDRVANMVSDGNLTFDEYQQYIDGLFKLRDGKEISDDAKKQMQVIEKKFM